jgi:hypothetical protein
VSAGHHQVPPLVREEGGGGREEGGGERCVESWHGEGERRVERECTALHSLFLFLFCVELEDNIMVHSIIYVYYFIPRYMTRSIINIKTDFFFVECTKLETEKAIYLQIYYVQASKQSIIIT